MSLTFDLSRQLPRSNHDRLPPVKAHICENNKGGGTSFDIALSSLCGDDCIITPISAADEALRQKIGIRGKQNYIRPVWCDQNGDEYWRSGGVLSNHISAPKAKEPIPPEIWDSYRKVTIWRDPYDVAISRYFWEGGPNTGRSFSEFTDRNRRLLTENARIAPFAGEAALDIYLRYETLADHPRRKDATVIVLRRNLAKQCASYIQRSDSVNITLAWQWCLTPSYRNVILNPESLQKLGVIGRALWYTLEMECREIYYQRVFGDCVRYVSAQLEEITQAEGAQRLLAQLGHHEPAILPPKTNANALQDNSALLGQIETFLSATGFEPETLVSKYLEAGFSLDQAPTNRTEFAVAS